MLTSEVVVVKSHHGISVKYSRHQDNRPTNLSLLDRDIGWGGVGVQHHGVNFI